MNTASWTPQQLQLLSDTDVLKISSTRTDGTFSPWWPIWAVVVNDGVFVRSTDGPHKMWFRNALRRDSGHVKSGSTVLGVIFEDHRDAAQEEISAAYQMKYRPSSSWSLRWASTSTFTIRVLPPAH